MFRTNKKDEQIKQAAYALNLCTVSVSQIIDYSDLNILEQEYEAILNNLNLENFPKDDALLDVLKQILDTITFFRIQEGDKKFIEKEYQQKMKDAIWSAVPNFGVIVAGGLNPVSIGITLASQVGIGYMNYRKQKSHNSLEYEKQKWQLERSAIEQFNALRRELFTTAWKLADNYNFPDEYRLTENQIKQYDEILMDSNLFRKYERLESIKEKFEAYPPFWYFLGNAANSIAQEFLKEDSLFKDDEELFRRKDELVKDYKEKATLAFEKFESVNNMPLLRTDEFAASCALEHIDLLDFNSDAEKIRNLLQIALKNSENKNDIKQLCAMNYLRLGEYENAQKLLLNLVSEDYNANTNAQILSNIYVQDEIENRSGKYLANYSLITQFVNPENIFSWPKENQDVDVIAEKFMKIQREKLIKEYFFVIKSVLDKYTIQFNRKFQTPDYSREYDDSYFLDSDEFRVERKNEFRYKNSSYDFSSIGVEYIDTLNTIVEALQKTNLSSAKEISSINNNLSEDSELKNAISSFIDSAEKNSTQTDLTENLFKIKISSALKTYLFEIAKEIGNKVQQMQCFNELISAESLLVNLCASENIPFPEILIQKENAGEKKFTDSRLIKYDSLGENIEQQKKIFDQREKQLQTLKDFEKSFNESGENKKIAFCIKGSNDFDKYFERKKLCNTFESLFRRGEILAVLDDKSTSNKDLYFTANVLYKAKKNFYGIYCLEDEVFYSNLKINYDEKHCRVLEKVINSNVQTEDNSIPNFYETNNNIDWNWLEKLLRELSKDENKEFVQKLKKNDSESNEKLYAKNVLAYFVGNAVFGPVGGIIAVSQNKKQLEMEKR